jgi:hypothetical protein
MAGHLDPRQEVCIMLYQSNQRPSRREMLRLIGGALAWFATAPFGASAAAELPHLSDANPSAASLGYTEDSSSVDSHKFPQHQIDQRCANCKFFQGTGAGYAPCQLYPGNAVNANGWCSGYAVK